MSIHVVHIEDEKPLRNILGVALRTAEPGIQLHQFGSGEEALPYIEANGHSVDLFVLDIRLPGTLSGLQVAQTIRDQGCPGHIVFTSAYSPPPRDFLEKMRAEYLPKPWHLVQLTEKLLKYKLDGASVGALMGAAGSANGGTSTTHVHASAIVGTRQRQQNKSGLHSTHPMPTAEGTLKEGQPVTHSTEPLPLCPACGKHVASDQPACSHCGTILDEQGLSNTIRIQPPETPVLHSNWSRGEVELGQQAMLVFQIGEVSLALPDAGSMIIGRLQVNHPDAEAAVDLTPYGGEQHGLSRRHIKLIRRGNMVYISDLGSMNGTWLNGRRLFANGEHLLREGDELRMSSMSIRIAFKTVPQTRPLA